MPYRVLLYYKFVTIDDPAAFVADHRSLCEALQLKGRILVAEEGINGTVSGTSADTEAYMKAVHADPRFADLQFKIDPHEGHAFHRLSVKARDEIVSLQAGEAGDARKQTGKHLSPTEFLELIESEEVLILDGRNDYESNIGRFKNAICPQVENFRDFPEWLDENLADAKNKKILTYCTGGIRCEKLTALMLAKGFEDVYQLDGGIVEYGKHPETQGKHFEGQCYVFDERILVPINSTDTAKVITNCHYCGESCERYVNCANTLCNDQFVCCPGCQETHASCCCDECREAPRFREPRAQVIS